MPQRDNLDRDCLIEMFAMDLRASGLEKEAEAFEISCLDNATTRMLTLHPESYSTHTWLVKR